MNLVEGKAVVTIRDGSVLGAATGNTFMWVTAHYIEYVDVEGTVRLIDAKRVKIKEPK